MRQVFCRFAEFELDRSAFQLRRKGRPVSLERIPLDLLFFLAERRGNLVTRQEIVDRIWGKNVFLDVDNAVNTAVRKIRRALRDDSECPRFVETVPAKGYRFVAPVHESHSSPEPASRLRHPRTSLVGREREMATLLAGLEEAVSGTGRLILISGEPGIGKTRLADELAERAQANRMVLLVGRCTGDERAAPFLPFVEILESIVSHTPGPENLRTALGEQGPELARLLPRLKTMVPEFSPRTDLGPAEVRRHLFSCYCDLVKRIARERSALMILDDLHWADDSTLALLEHLTQRLADIPMLVVGTYRDAELDLVRGLGNFLEKLLRGRAATHVKLKALLPDGVEAVLQSLSGQEPPAGVTETIFAESTGNPFLIEELFRHLEEENRLYDSAGKFRRRLEISDQEAPPTVRLVVSRRLERLSDKTRKILGTAAVIGRWFTFEVLRSSCEADADAILECVEEAEKSGLISSVEDSPGARFEFSHELVRQAVIAGMSAARRQALHVTVARTIERVNPSAIEDHLAELAHHYRLGGNRAKAIDYLRRAGEQAVAHAMYSEAESYFAAAQDEITPMPASPERDALELGVCSSFAETMSVSSG
jgi:predicted ATPase